jgi:hypothetical protein
VYDKVERTRLEVSVAYYKVLSSHSLGMTEENKLNPLSG